MTVDSMNSPEGCFLGSQVVNEGEYMSAVVPGITWRGQRDRLYASLPEQDARSKLVSPSI